MKQLADGAAVSGIRRDLPADPPMGIAQSRLLGKARDCGMSCLRLSCKPRQRVTQAPRLVPVDLTSPHLPSPQTCTCRAWPRQDQQHRHPFRYACHSTALILSVGYRCRSRFTGCPLELPVSRDPVRVPSAYVLGIYQVDNFFFFVPRPMALSTRPLGQIRSQGAQIRSPLVRLRGTDGAPARGGSYREIHRENHGSSKKGERRRKKKDIKDHGDTVLPWLPLFCHEAECLFPTQHASGYAKLPRWVWGCVGEGGTPPSAVTMIPHTS